MKFNGGWFPFFGNRKHVLYREGMAEFLDYLEQFTHHNDHSFQEELQEAFDAGADMLMYNSWQFEWLERVFFEMITDRVYMKYKDGEQE